MAGKDKKIPQGQPPLQGIRVLDLTRIIAGPYCAMVLGDLGAEIIKIEQPKIGDESRAWGPPWVKEVSAYFISINRNKKSLTLNLKHPQGIEIFKSLVKTADVVLENFRPGTMEEMGLGYEALQRMNPRLVYCDMTGYGTEGPYRDKPGVDVIVSAIGGLMSITGQPAGEPVKVGVPLTDVLTGLYAFGAIASALLLREHTGKGQRISINLLAMQLATLINIGSNYLLGGIIPRRWGSAHPNIVPYEAHRAKDDYLIFGVLNERMWKSFCHLLGMDALQRIPGLRTIPGESRIGRTSTKSSTGRLLKKQWMNGSLYSIKPGFPAGRSIRLTGSSATPRCSTWVWCKRWSIPITEK